MLGSVLARIVTSGVPQSKFIETIISELAASKLWARKKWRKKHIERKRLRESKHSKSSTFVNRLTLYFYLVRIEAFFFAQTASSSVISILFVARKGPKLIKMGRTFGGHGLLQFMQFIRHSFRLWFARANASRMENKGYTTFI